MKIGIAGAGIMGRLLAFSFINQGHDVTLFDKPSKKLNCSTTAAGLLTPLAELEKADDVIYKLGMQSLYQHWPDILTKLNADIYFKQSGSLVLAHSRDKTDLHRLVNLIKNKLLTVSENCYPHAGCHPYDGCHPRKGCHPREGCHPRAGGDLFHMDPRLRGDDSLCGDDSRRKDDSLRVDDSLSVNDSNNDNILLLHSTEIEALEPELNKFHHAYYFSQEGQIDNQHLMYSLENHLKKKGINWQEREINNIDQENFDWMFDCRGLGAKNIFEHLHAVRGELIWLYAPQVTISRPIRFMHPRYSLYIVPRPNYHYIIGASEIQSQDESEISVKTTLELLTAAYSLHSGFAEARIIKTLTHCRPTLAHYLPQIKYKNRMLAINGLYRHGFLIAPALVNEINSYMQTGFSSLMYPQLWSQYD